MFLMFQAGMMGIQGVGMYGAMNGAMPAMGEHAVANISLRMSAGPLMSCDGLLRIAVATTVLRRPVSS